MKLPSDQDITGRNLGDEELVLLKDVISSGVLNSTKGIQVKTLEGEFAQMIGTKHAIAVSSGSAAIHAAICAINPDPGSEIITTPVTDMGAITPIIYQGCIPVFADIDPQSYNVTSETIAKQINPNTKAIIVTHLFGNPCDMKPIMELAHSKNIPVIEDCAQSFLATFNGELTGSIGDIGVFSFQQGKHMTTGEGGIVITDDEKYARRCRLFVNKAWGDGDPKPDHYFIALNYRLTELQGAVGLAQLRKLKGNVQKRRETAAFLDTKLKSIDGIQIPTTLPDSEHSYWKYCIDVDSEITGLDVGQMASDLKSFGIFSAPRYIQKPAFGCQILKDGRIFGSKSTPLTSKQMSLWQDEERLKIEYKGAYQALSRMLVLPWNEFYAEKHAEYISDKIHLCIKK